jgi:hypothetical protein
MNATLRVDVVCDTQEELEQLIADHGFQNEVIVKDWSPNGPAGGNAEASLYGHHTAVYELALLLGYEEEIVLRDLEPDDPDYEDWPPHDPFPPSIQ